MSGFLNLIRRATIYLLISVLFFAFGFAVINYLIMPFMVRSRDTTKVPNITGMEFEKARALCMERGLVINKQGEKYEEDMPPGFIIVQDPLPELVIKRGRRVDVIVSLGQELTSIPDVTGLDAERATSILSTSGLKVIGERHESSEVFSEGKVMALEPPAGSRVKSGTEVTLVISTGAITFMMPLLEERSFDEAKHIIEEMGLVVSNIEYVKTDFPVGTVIDQKPPPGSRVVRGQEVELVISSGE